MKGITFFNVCAVVLGGVSSLQNVHSIEPNVKVLNTKLENGRGPNIGTKPRIAYGVTSRQGLKPGTSRTLCRMLPAIRYRSGDTMSLLCLLFYPEDRGSTFLRNVDAFLPECKATHPETRSIRA
jgi:hypothetical protein